MYAVDTRACLAAWEDYFRGLTDKQANVWTREKGARWWQCDTRNAPHELVGSLLTLVTYGQVGGQKLIGGIGAGMDWKQGVWRLPPFGGSVLEGIVRPALNSLYERPQYGVRTLLCAYVDENAAGFVDNDELGDNLQASRQRLLDHPDRFAVRMRDVTDDANREALLGSGVPPLNLPLPLAGELLPLDPDAPNEPKAPPLEGGLPFGRPKPGQTSSATAWPWLAGLAAAVGATWWLAKRT